MDRGKKNGLEDLQVALDLEDLVLIVEQLFHRGRVVSNRTAHGYAPSQHDNMWRALDLANDVAEFGLDPEKINLFVNFASRSNTRLATQVAKIARTYQETLKRAIEAENAKWSMVSKKSLAYVSAIKTLGQFQDAILKAFEAQELRAALKRGDPIGITAALLNGNGSERDRFTLRWLTGDRICRNIALEFAERGSPYAVRKVLNALLGRVLAIRGQANALVMGGPEESHTALDLHKYATQLADFCVAFGKTHDEAHPFIATTVGLSEPVMPQQATDQAA